MSVGGIYEYFPSKQSLARAAIRLVTDKLTSELKYINNTKISHKEKLCRFVEVYFAFTQKHPEMIDYFFRVYLSNREFFCEDDVCGFALARDFIDEMEKLIEDGIDTGEFKKQDFYVSFSIVVGILGAMTFLNGEKVLDDDLTAYKKETADAIYKALAT